MLRDAVRSEACSPQHSSSLKGAYRSRFTDLVCPYQQLDRKRTRGQGSTRTGERHLDRDRCRVKSIVAVNAMKTSVATT